MEISFGRAIEIDSDTNSIWNYKDKKLDNATMGVIDTIKGKSSIYDKKTSKKIGDFLKAQIGDYDPKSGIYARRIDGKPYIFTGEDAVKAREINKKAFDEMNELEEKYQKGANENSSLSERVELESEQLHRIYRQNIYIKRDKSLLALVEDGSHRNKPDSIFRFKGDNQGRINKIQYYSSRYENGEYVTEEKSLTF